jgi:RNA polymerase sporulation-specific sigma factor
MNALDIVNRLVSENQGLVVHFAKQHQARVARIRLSDLIAAGKIGLVKAAERFDPAKAKFSTYAASWIRKYMFKAVKGKLPGVSLNAPIGDDIGDDITLLEVIADENAAPASELVSTQDIREAFRRMMVDAGLDDREKKILSLRFGLDDDKPKTQKQIAKKLGLSRARVSQLEKIARGKIAA